MKNLTWQNPEPLGFAASRVEELFVAQVLIKIVKLKCCGIKAIDGTILCSYQYLTYNLPGSITRPLFTEYNNRVKEIGDILGWEDSAYKDLREYESVIESLLAMSLFYRYVLGHFQAATSFYKTVNQKCGNEKECAIRIGRIVLDKEQQNHLLGAVIAFGKIREKYNIFPAFFEFSETAQFLRNCKDLLTIRYYEDEKSV